MQTNTTKAESKLRRPNFTVFQTSPTTYYIIRAADGLCIAKAISAPLASLVADVLNNGGQA